MNPRFDSQLRFGWNAASPLLLLLLSNCGGNVNRHFASEAGGAVNAAGQSSVNSTSAVGGGNSTGGKSAAGGASSTGGATNAGGAQSTGGRTGETTPTGGALSVGGNASTGGAFVAGGVSPTGGTTGFVTSSTGGKSSTGGSANVSGANSTGGVVTTGGAKASGGSISTGGTTVAGGAVSTGGTRATGGAVGTGGAIVTGGRSNVGGVSSTGGTGPFVSGVGVCAPPCGAVFQANTEYSFADAGATLFLDPSTGDMSLRNNPDQAPASAVTVVIFEFSSTDGYGIASTGNVWFEYIDNYAYSTGYGGYSVELNRPMTAHMVNAATGQTYIVDFTLGAQSVTIQGARIASCDKSKATTCQSANDCTKVDSGQTTGLSAACASCYSAFTACSETNCATDCPGQGGNVCMNCQVSQCSVAFLACSGLDYMPPGTLTLPFAG